VPYLLLGLQDVQWAMRNSRGASKLAQTPHVNQKKIIIIKKKQQQYHLMYIHTIFPVSNEGFEGDKSTSGPHLPITIPSTVVLCNLKRRGGREEDTIVLADARSF